MLVVERELGQADDDIPALLPSMLLQPAHRGLDVLGAGGERLAHNGDVPPVAAIERAQVGHASCDLGRRGWISHEPDVNGLHCCSVPALGRGSLVTARNSAQWPNRRGVR